MYISMIYINIAKYYSLCSLKENHFHSNFNLTCYFFYHWIQELAETKEKDKTYNGFQRKICQFYFALHMCIHWYVDCFNQQKFIDLRYTFSTDLCAQTTISCLKLTNEFKWRGFKIFVFYYSNDEFKSLHDVYQ